MGESKSHPLLPRHPYPLAPKGKKLYMHTPQLINIDHTNTT